jgi:hypothetical protein
MARKHLLEETQLEWNYFLSLMEQHTLKHVNNCLNTNIYSYLLTSVAYVIKLFTAVSYDFS